MLNNIKNLLTEVDMLKKKNDNCIITIKMGEVVKNFLCFVGAKVNTPPSITSIYCDRVRLCWSRSNGATLSVDLWEDGDCRLVINSDGSDQFELFFNSYPIILFKILEFESE